MQFLIRNSKFLIRSVKPQRGFTLIEMLVAIGLFAIVMLIAVGSLVSIIGANRRAQAQQDVVNSLAFALENVTRNLRTGTTYHCGESGDLTEAEPCVTGETFIAFEGQNGNSNDDNDQIVFRLTGTTIERSLDSGASYEPMTPAAVQVERLDFFVDGVESSTEQPRVRIITNGFIEDERGIRSDFNVDTLVSQRLFGQQ